MSEDITTEEVVTEAAPDQETDPVAVLTADLQRLQAEYANYRKRVERDRALAHELAIGSVLGEFLSVLDDIDRAESHGELSGGFKSVADQIVNTTTRIGLEKYGEVGDAFDPAIHAQECGIFSLFHQGWPTLIRPGSYKNPFRINLQRPFF